MEITVSVIISGVTGAGILGLVAERIYTLARNKKNGGCPNSLILKALGDLGKTSDSIKKEVGNTQADVRVMKNEVTNINKRCGQHLKAQSEINKNHAISISKNTDKLFDLAKDKGGG